MELTQLQILQFEPPLISEKCCSKPFVAAEGAAHAVKNCLK